MNRLLRCVGLLILSLAFSLPTLLAQSTGDAKKDVKQDAKTKKEKPKPDWSGEVVGVLTVLEDKDVSRLAFTVQVTSQIPEINTAAQNELAQLQLKLAQQQVTLAQAKTAASKQSAMFNLQATTLKIEQAKTRLVKFKTSKFDMKCKAADNMRVRYFAAVQPMNPDTGEYIKLTKELIEEARGHEGYPGFKADHKVLKKGQLVRVFVSKDSAVPAALLDKNQKDNDKLKLDDIQEQLKNRYGVVMIVVVSDPAKGTN